MDEKHEVYEIARIPRGPRVLSSRGGCTPRYKSALDSSVAGPLGEAHAIAFLAGQGYHVFVGFGNTPCDLIAMKDNVTIRVEVKTSTGTSRGSVYSVPQSRSHLYDVLIWVIPTEGVLIVNPTQVFVGDGEW